MGGAPSEHYEATLEQPQLHIPSIWTQTTHLKTHRDRMVPPIKNKRGYFRPLWPARQQRCAVALGSGNYRRNGHEQRPGAVRRRLNNATR